MRINNSSMNRYLKKDGELFSFYHYNKDESNLEYDADSQLPVNSAQIIQEYADVQNVSMQQISTSGGIINTTSKIFLVGVTSSLDLNDEVLDNSNAVIYKIVFVDKKANVKRLFVNIVTDGKVRS